MTAAKICKQLQELVESGDYKQAAASSDDFQDYRSQLLPFKARCLIAAGDFSSLEHFIKAAKMKRSTRQHSMKDQAFLQLEQAYLLYRQHKLQPAMDLLKGLAKMSLRDGNYEYEEVECLKAQVYFKQARYEKALEIYEEIQKDSESDLTDMSTNYLATTVALEDIKGNEDLERLLADFKRSYESTPLIDSFELRFNTLILASILFEDHRDQLAQQLTTVVELKKAAKKLDDMDETTENTSLCLVHESFLLSMLARDKNAGIACTTAMRKLLENSKAAEAEEEEEEKGGSDDLPSWLRLLFVNNIIALERQLSRRASGPLHGDAAFKMLQELQTFSKEFDSFLSGKAAASKGSAEDDQSSVLKKLAPGLQRTVLLNYAIYLKDTVRVGDCLRLCQKIGLAYPTLQHEVEFLRCAALMAQKKYAKAKHALLSLHSKRTNSGAALTSKEVVIVESYILYLVCCLTEGKKGSVAESKTFLEKVQFLTYTAGIDVILLSLSSDASAAETYMKQGLGFYDELLSLSPEELWARHEQFLSVNDLVIEKASMTFDMKKVFSYVGRLLKEYLNFLIKRERYQEGYDLVQDMKQKPHMDQFALLQHLRHQELVCSAFANLEAAEGLLDSIGDVNDAVAGFDPEQLLSDSVQLTQEALFSNAKASEKGSERDETRVKRNKERKVIKARRKRREKYLSKLSAQEVDVVAGRAKLNPERWLQKHERKGHTRSRRNDKFTGGQGDVNEKEAEKLDVKRKVEKAEKKEQERTKGKRVGGSKKSRRNRR